MLATTVLALGVAAAVGANPIVDLFTTDEAELFNSYAFPDPARDGSFQVQVKGIIYKVRRPFRRRARESRPKLTPPCAAPSAGVPQPNLPHPPAVQVPLRGRLGEFY
jgi:hypothetical protein